MLDLSKIRPTPDEPWSEFIYVKNNTLFSGNKHCVVRVPFKEVFGFDTDLELTFLKFQYALLMPFFEDTSLSWQFREGVIEAVDIFGEINCDLAALEFFHPDRVVPCPDFDAITPVGDNLVSFGLDLANIGDISACFGCDTFSIVRNSRDDKYPHLLYPTYEGSEAYALSMGVRNVPFMLAGGNALAGDYQLKVEQVDGNGRTLFWHSNSVPASDVMREVVRLLTSVDNRALLDHLKTLTANELPF